MVRLLHLLAEQPLLLLAILLGLGAAVGRLSLGSVRLGPAAVLFAAVGLAALGTAYGVALEVPETVGNLGLVLFTYTVGVMTGPQFFASLRTGWRRMLSVLAAFATVALVAVGLGRVLGLSAPVVAGTFAGALTNTPALAAAAERSGQPAEVTVGYSISYLGGVLGMLLAAAWVLQRSRATDPPAAAAIEQRTIRVEHVMGMTVEELERRYGGAVAFTRVKHEHFANPTVVAEEDERVGVNDLLLAVGPVETLDRVSRDLGHRSSHDLFEDRRDLDFRRVTISNRDLAGRPLGSIDLDGRYGATISRVRRGDVDLVANADLVLQLGDRVRVIAPRQRLGEVAHFLGDSDRGMSDINLGGLAVGLGLGLLLGLVHVPLPGGGFTLGAAAGTLLAGLVLGRLGRVGPVLLSMSNGAATSISSLGMVTFLAYAGTKAGQRVVAALGSDQGWRIAVLGLALTGLAVLILTFASLRLHRLTGIETAGGLAGAQTQPAVLAFVQERTGFDARVGVAYAVVYPAAMIVKIALAQILAGL